MNHKQDKKSAQYVATIPAASVTPAAHYVSAPGPDAAAAEGGVLIVGSPNVGKSALFNRLTGRYVTVSNYPGTTVEVSHGRARLAGREVGVIDTPGMYSLLPITDEERVAREILLAGSSRVVVHVIDAKSIQRMLGLTLQLIESRLSVVLVLNMWDEAQDAGIRIDCDLLEKQLGVPVVPTVATTGKGMGVLVRRIESLLSTEQIGRDGQGLKIDYGPVLEKAIAAIEPHLEGQGGVGRRGRALLLLQGDHQVRDRLIQVHGPAAAEKVASTIFDACADLKSTAHYHISLAVKEHVQGVLAQRASFPPPRSDGWRDRLSDLCMSPWTGFPILLAVLYLGLYQFVGVFGAGTCVDFLQNGLFGKIIPSATWLAERYIPWPAARDLLVGDYGIISLGFRYAIAIILPIVTTFFLAFSLIEDSGYLPRLAVLIDRLFKKIGLNGRAVIPLVLGLGCDSMATMVTRTLETKRERVIATFLLALAIPCSAQIGVLMALLSGRPLALAVWAGVMAAIFLGAGLLMARFLPGQRPSFYMELPRLRLPRLGNVLVKTYTRLVWYFKEVLPLFVLASVLIWLGRLDWWGLLPEGGVFGMLVRGLEPAVRAIGLPDQAAGAFLFGFFRRDYGAAGLFDLQHQGLLAGNQLVVAAVTMTLFLPCVAQFIIMKKERGWKMTLCTSLFIVVFAFGVGWLLSAVLNLTGAHL